MPRRGAKITVVGVGAVGACIAYTLATGGLATELALIDADHRRAEGQAMDLGDAMAHLRPVHIYASDYADSAGSSIVILAAGAPRAPGQSRLDLARQNLAILKETFPRVLRYSPDAIFLIVTNPVDIITYAATRLADMGDERVLGTGTVLDTSRFRRLLSRHVRVDPRNVHAYVVGEHGDSLLALWSRVSVAGYGLDEYCREMGLPPVDRQEILARVTRAGAEIITRKGATQFGVSIATARIVEAILRNERSVLTVSGLVEGVYGVEGPNCFSLPSLVDGGGRRRTLLLDLAPDELEALKRSAGLLKEIHKEVGLA